MEEEHHEIVIVGGGICGLSTALALHRKGIESLVLEKSNALQTTGTAIGVFANGWRALDQLGVGMELRSKSLPLNQIRDERLRNNTSKVTPCRNEFRCLKRTDLIKTLADNLPAASIHFGRHVVAIEIDTVSSFPILHINDGSIIKAKVLIGCDGSDSVVANSLGMGAPKLFQISAIRGFTSYPNGHLCGSFFLRLIEDNVVFGRIPVDNNSVYWFVAWPSSPEDSEVREDPILIRDATLDHLRDYPTEITEMVQQSDLSSLSLARIKYRAPWQLMFTRNHWRVTTTVAGDAMHVMGPFMGQGGSAAMEDSVVLARCLAQEIRRRSPGVVVAEMILPSDDEEFKSRVGAGLHRYAKERRFRVLRLSIQSYLIGVAFTSSSRMKKFASILLLLLFFGGSSLSHTRYDCGGL